MSRRLSCWLIFFTVILGFGWFKSHENYADRQRQLAWQEQVIRLNEQSQQEYRQLRNWLNELRSLPNVRQQVEAKLNDGQPFTYRFEKGEDIADWTHPDLGIRLVIHLRGDTCTGHRLSIGNVSALYPQPRRTSTTGRAESVRVYVANVGGMWWLAALLIAFFFRRLGMIATEVMLALAIVCGVAWSTSPHYPLTARGVFSNDPLAFAAIMYVMSIVFLAFHAAKFESDCCLNHRVRLRFGMRSSLIVTALVAILSAMGPFGYFAICSLAAGAAIFGVVMRLILADDARFSGRKRPHSISDQEAPTAVDSVS